jgi:cytochrome c biogenesis protein CcmG, thiol:disulfide interchange protein DsbE
MAGPRLIHPAGRSPAGRGRFLRMLAAAVAVAAAGCAPDRPPAVGDAAPRFGADRLDGARFELADARGDVVLVNIWATWCYPCRREMPALQELHEQLAGTGLRVVAVSIDAAGSEPEIRAFLEEYGIDFTILHDPAQRVTRAFGTRGVPETFLVGRDGTLRHHWIGRIDARSPAVRMPVYQALDEAVRHAAGG